MPRFDGTGPWGGGPMTGGGRGFCNPGAQWYGAWFGPGFGFGRGFGRGRGSRRFMCRGFPWSFGWWGDATAGWYDPASMPPYPGEASEELELLRARSRSLKSALDDINRRVEELEKELSGTSKAETV